MKFSFLNQIKSDTRGITIIIAMGLAFFILAFTFGVATIVESTNKSIKAFQRSTNAQLQAQGLQESLKLIGNQHESGYNISASDCDTAISRILANTNLPEDVSMSCELIGRVDEPVTDGTDPWYTVPAPGTGNAVARCSGADYKTDIDHPCNWNKLALGSKKSSNVVIPLYYDSAGLGQSTTSIVNPVNMPLGAFRLRVRTPCADGTYDPECDRYVLDAGNGTIDEDETVVRWQIIGECTKNNRTETCALGAWDAVKELENNIRDPYENSEIYESLINDLSEEINIENWGYTPSQMYGEDPVTSSIHNIKISDFISDTTTGLTIHKPYLKLTLLPVPLETTPAPNVERVPYLEYQLLTDHPVSNTEKFYNVFVNYQGQAFQIHETEAEDRNVIDFAIQN